MIERVHKLVKRSTTPPESVIQLLENTTIGTNGALYQLLDTREKIQQLHQPNFIYLERNGQAIGNVTICERTVTLNTDQFDGLYIRYFAFKQLFQGGTKARHGQSNFHQYFKALFETSAFDPTKASNDKSMYWAYIDPLNVKSFNMNSRFGFTTIGQFKTTAFSRVRPKISKRVSPVTTEEMPEVKSKIEDFYADFDFYSDTHLFENNHFYVLKVDGEIIAGVQANPVHWKIKGLPGLSGKILLKTAPIIPRLSKLIKPNDHRFLATEGLFWKKGHEDFVVELLEGVLAATQHHSLLIWTDSNNHMLDRLDLKWGFIQKTKPKSEIEIVAKFNQFSAEEIEAIKSHKKYLSGFDMT